MPFIQGNGSKDAFFCSLGAGGQLADHVGERIDEVEETTVVPGQLQTGVSELDVVLGAVPFEIHSKGLDMAAEQGTSYEERIFYQRC